MHDADIGHGALAPPLSQLKSFELTHFQYQDGDSIGRFLALISLAPIFIIVAEATVVFSRREVIGILMLAGQLANEGFSLGLKEIICQNRPSTHLGDGYGMPSSHAQFMGFFAAFVVIYLQAHVKTALAQKLAVQGGACVLGVLVAISRVYLGYHTKAQVGVGSLVGIASGFAWYLFVQRVVRRCGILGVVLRSRTCTWLLIRDSHHIPDIARAEYRLSMGPGHKQAVE